MLIEAINTQADPLCTLIASIALLRDQSCYLLCKFYVYHCYNGHWQLSGAVSTEAVIHQRSVTKTMLLSDKKSHRKAVASKYQSVHEKVNALLHRHLCFVIFSIIVSHAYVSVCKSQGLNMVPFSWRTLWPSQRRGIYCLRWKEKRVKEEEKVVADVVHVDMWGERGSKRKSMLWLNLLIKKI